VNARNKWQVLLRGRREEALQIYGRARERVNEEDVGMGEILTRQIARMSSNEPLERITAMKAHAG